jgi:DHA1 family inner membrane transport protein
VASLAYTVDRRRAPAGGRERIVASHVPQEAEAVHH